MTYSPGDIILARFPFTDLKSTKKRPVLVVCPPDYQDRYGDIVGLALTTVEQETGLALKDWEEVGLPKPTWVKPLVATFSSKFVDKWLGNLPSSDYPSINCALNIVWHRELR